MKRTCILIALVTFITCNITSCQTDGVYNPKGKISKIYIETPTQAKKLIELWTWKGNQLDKIEHVYDDASWVEEFTYNDNKLIRIDDKKHQEYTEFQYDKNKLSKILHYSDGQLLCESLLIFDDNELEEILINDYGYKRNHDTTNLHLNPFEQILPTEIAAKIMEHIDQTISQPQKGLITYSFELDWDDNNISEIETVLFDHEIEYKFFYDKKANPFKGYLGIDAYSTNVDFAQTGSANNIVRIIEKVKVGNVESTTGIHDYTYKYDGKLPIERRFIDEEGSYFVYYFEYE